MYHTIALSEDRGIVTILLNRPEVRNAFNSEMIAELTDACSEVAVRDEVRVVVIRGAGRSFSAGADVNWMRSSLDLSFEENLADAENMSDMFAAIDALPHAVVGVVHGAALGGGMGLLAVCDVVIADEDTVFGFTETRLGIIPAVISRFVIPKIGTSWARALFLTAERFNSDLARQIGLVHWIVPAQGLDEQLGRVQADLLASGPNAVREAKRLVKRMEVTARGDWRALTTDRIAELRASPEGQEGMRAFLDKRAPSWVGENSE